MTNIYRCMKAMKLLCILTTFLLQVFPSSCFCQENGNSPYPIIFVHGWAGSDQNWVENGSWIPFLSNFGWTNGEVINICLDATKGTLHDNASLDVSLLGTSSIPGDYFFINFAVKVTNYPSFYPYPEVAMFIKTMDDSQNYFELYSGDGNSISSNDIIAIGSGDEQEIVRVVYADVQNNIYTINRYEFGTAPNNHIWSTQIKVHSNLSNQASFVKAAKGIKLAIDYVKDITKKNKVILVCHSMGGVNARMYVQSSDYENDVALIATYSTPHLGSNKSDLEYLDPQYQDYDLQSDAVRDLRYSTEANFLNSDPPSPPYGDLPDNAVTLFGGTENLYWPSTFDFYSYDYNGDGIEGNPGQPFGTPVDGLNRKANGSNIFWPPDVNLHCVIGEQYLLGIPLGNDGVVRIDRQYPWPYIIPTSLLETFTFNLPGPPFPFYIAHFWTHHQFPEVLLGLDEPDNRNTAYEIPDSTIDNNYTTGFTTFQPGGGSSDVDYFKFIASFTGNIKVKVFDIPNVNSWELSIYDSPTGTAIATATNIQQPGSSCELIIPATSGHWYYIGFYSEALENSYQNPYKIQVSSQIEISSAQFNQSSYSPETAASITVALGNSLNDATVTFTCNSQTYTCNGIGGGIYQKTFIVPSNIGNYPITVNASKSGYINAAPFNTTLVIENLGASLWPPSIELTYPNNEVCHDECYIIWDDSDPDNNAVIYLYYDSNNSGLNGTCINANNPIFEDGGDAFVWNTVNMPEGIYWVYATIDDGTTLTSDYSPGYIEINHPDPNSDFSYSSKNVEEDDGDGDGIIESGESFDLDIWIKNLSYVTQYNYVEATLTTSNNNVTITSNQASYGNFTPRQTKKGDYDFDIQVANGYVGNVAFQINLDFKDENGYMFYQVLDIPNIYISSNVSPSFQVVDFQIIDDGSKCNNDGILQSGENSIDYRLKLLNNGTGTAFEVRGEAELPPEFSTSVNGADYPNILVGHSEWPDPDDHYFLNSIPSDYTGTINAELTVTWGNELFSQLIPFSLEVFPAPRLKYNPETYDFGIKELGDTAIIPVAIWNIGSENLVISQIENLSLNPNNWISGAVLPITITPEDTTFFYINIKRDLQCNVTETFRIHSNNHTDTIHDILIGGTFYQPMPQGYVEVWNSDPSTLDGDGWIEPADLDNDGLIDLVTFNNASLFIWEQSAVNSLEFVHKFTYTFTGTEVYIQSIRIGNCDGDNKTDIVIREWDQVTEIAHLRVFETSGNDQYAQVWIKTLSSPSYLYCTEVGNCDADNLDEILLHENGSVYVYNSTGNNVYSTTWNSGTTISNYGAEPSFMGYMTTGDTDQDGKKEIIFPGSDEYIFIWEKNTSGTGYTLAHDPLVTFVPSPEGSEVYPKVFDIDNDNTNEIIISGDGDGFQFSVFNPISWTYEFHNSSGLYDEFSSPAISDLNGNGNSEVFLGEDGSGLKKMRVYEYLNGSYFEIFTSNDFGDDIYNIRSYDFDNDNVPELVLALADNFRIWRYEAPVLMPDLQIAPNNIGFSNSAPTDNDTIQISALVRNLGTSEAENIPVEFFQGVPSSGNRIDSVTISQLNTSSDSLINIQWIPYQSGSFDIYVVLDREDTIEELDSTNNRSFNSISILDNDTIPPILLNHSHVELFGDNDGLIEDDEYIRFNWSIFDESGIDSTYILLNNNMRLNGLLTNNGSFYTVLTNQPSGLFPYEIHSIDNDNSPLASIVYDTIIIIQHAPHILSNYPEDGDTSVAVSDSIVVDFDLPMSSSSINSLSFLLFDQDSNLVSPLSVTYDPMNLSATFEPGSLDPGVEYRAVVLSGPNGVKDMNNNCIESDYGWSFSTIQEALAANFIASATTGGPGLNVGFTDLSTGNPDTWNWNFGDGSTSNVKNPNHNYDSVGIYTVSLTVNSSAGSNSMTKTDYINIQIQTKIWTGNISTDWNHQGNWIPMGIPLPSDNIFIPSTATLMPLVHNNGLSANDVNIGSEAKLTINQGYTLTINGTLTLEGPCGTFIDQRDNRVYHAILIGSQCWMKENINVGTRINGSQNQSNNDTIEKYCYDNVELNCSIYGGLYQWDEMMQGITVEGSQGICPLGWHVPTNADFMTLSNFLGGDNISGGALKELGTNHWAAPNTGATNSSAYTGLPGGYRHSDGIFGGLTGTANIQSSTQDGTTFIRYWGLYYNNIEFLPYLNPKTFGFSVRCIKD